MSLPYVTYRSPPRPPTLAARYDAIVADIGRLMLESANQDVAFESVPGCLARELDIAAVAIVSSQPHITRFAFAPQSA